MLFVTGPTGAGKTHFANFLVKEGFDFIDTGPTLRKLWIEADTETGFRTFLAKAQGLFTEEFTDWHLAQEISEQLARLGQNSTKDLLVVGNRSPEGIAYLKKSVVNANGRTPIIVYIEAEEKRLLERYREREGVNISLEQFRTQELLPDAALGLERIRDVADYILINNESVPKFEAKILGLVYGKLGIERESFSIERK